MYQCEGQTRPGGQPRPGDLVEIFRPGYQHWAVYVGGGDVVHMTTSRELNTEHRFYACYDISDFISVSLRSR